MPFVPFIKISNIYYSLYFHDEAIEDTRESFVHIEGANLLHGDKLTFEVTGV